MRSYIKQAKGEKLDWQTALIEDVQTEIKRIISTALLAGWTWVQVNSAVAEAVEGTEEIETEELRKRAKRSLLLFAVVQYRTAVAALKGLDLGLLPKMAAYVSNPVKKTEEAVLKGLAGKYWETGVPLREYSRDYMKRVRQVFNGLAGSTAKDDYSGNVSLRNVAEMTVRYEAAKSRTEDIKRSGEVYVWISAHANCSERCAAAQGKLYSLNGTSGTTEDGHTYIPLEEVTEVYYTTKAGKRYRNGILYGFNCRHYLIPYSSGVKPVPVPSEVVDKQREINDTQRSMERAVRKLRDIAVTAPTKKERIEARAEAVKAYRAYKAYSRENSVAYYPSRVEIWSGDKTR